MQVTWFGRQRGIADLSADRELLLNIPKGFIVIEIQNKDVDVDWATILV